MFLSIKDLVEDQGRKCGFVLEVMPTTLKAQLTENEKYDSPSQKNYEE